ncbi:MAG: MlaA family lipoprotein [Oceanicaulis sp.]
MTFTNASTARLLALLVLILPAACASTPDAREANDPFEPVNRAVFQFNTAVDGALIEPAANAYVAVTPEPARDSVRNVFDNLNRPVVFANDLLQGDIRAASETAGSFVLDTTLGLLGILPLAKRAGIEQHSEDFGQTLARWGVPEGPYLMLPVLGPSSVRDGTGRFVDRYPHPLNWNEDYSESTEAWLARGLNGIDARARAQNAMDTLDRTAIDPYVQLRSAWRQNREQAIRDGAGEEGAYDDLPEFD